MRATTTRGVLGEMLLPLARWPMRSPWRFGAVLLAVLTLLVLVGRVGGNSFPAAGPASTPTVATSKSVGTTSTVPTTAPAAATVAPDAATAAAVSSVAVDFVRAWAHPERTPASWLRTVNLQPLTESYAQSLGSTDPGTIPATRVVGAPTVLSTTATEAQVQVTTDGPTVLVVLARDGDRWAVANLRPLN